MERESLSIHITTFLEALSMRKKNSAHTWRAYELDLRYFFDFWNTLEHDNATTYSFKKAVSLYKTQLTRNKIAPNTIARKMSCLNSFISHCNPAINVEKKVCPRPLIRQKQPIAIPVKELTQLLDLTSDAEFLSVMPVRDKCIVELLYATGIRSSELVQIRLSHIDSKKRTISIYDTHGQVRTVFFGPRTYTQMQRYLSEERPKYADKNDHLFVSRQGHALTTRTIQRICIACGKLIGKKKLTPQILRNSFALHLLERGISVAQLQELLGHQAHASTQRYTR